MKPLEVDKLGKQFQFITLDIRDVNSAVTNDKNSSSKVRGDWGGPQGGSWTRSTGLIHRPGSMFCIRPATQASSTHEKFDV